MVDPLFTEWSLLVTTTVYQLFDTLNKCLHQVSNLWGSICWRKYSDFCKEIGFGKYFIAICHIWWMLSVITVSFLFLLPVMMENSKVLTISDLPKCHHNWQNDLENEFLKLVRNQCIDCMLRLHIQNIRRGMPCNTIRLAGAIGCNFLQTTNGQ